MLRYLGKDFVFLQHKDLVRAIAGNGEVELIPSLRNIKMKNGKRLSVTDLFKLSEKEADECLLALVKEIEKQFLEKNDTFKVSNT